MSQELLAFLCAYGPLTVHNSALANVKVGRLHAVIRPSPAEGVTTISVYDVPNVGDRVVRYNGYTGHVTWVTHLGHTIGVYVDGSISLDISTFEREWVVRNES